MRGSFIVQGSGVGREAVLFCDSVSGCVFSKHCGKVLVTYGSARTTHPSASTPKLHFLVQFSLDILSQCLKM